MPEFLLRHHFDRHKIVAIVITSGGGGGSSSSGGDDGGSWCGLCNSTNCYTTIATATVTTATAITTTIVGDVDGVRIRTTGRFSDLVTILRATAIATVAVIVTVKKTKKHRI